MDNKLFDYSPIIEREPIHWPDGARVAFYVGLNVEHFYVDRPATSLNEGTAALVPDALNYGWRDYGLRVGIWRVIESLDRHGIRASALLNSDVCERYPQIIEAGRGVFRFNGLSGPDFVRIVEDQLDQLYADSQQSGRVMALALHPFVIGQPFRHKYLDQALEYVASHEGVWLTTSDEIAEHYARAPAAELSRP